MADILTCTYFIVVCFGVCSSASLKSRMDYLEMQVSRESFKTRSDIIELRELITYMNATGSFGGGEVVDSSNIETKLNTLDEKLERFMQDQYDRSMALSKAISEEKAMTRNMLKIIQDLADSNTESVLEIEQAIELNEVERENFKKEWKSFEDGIKNDMTSLSAKTEKLEDKLENVDGNVIIHSVEEKTPCPENWFQNLNTCYFYQKQETLNWYGASIRCHDFGGKLAEPDTEAEMIYILLTIDGDNVWVGATDEDNEGKWIWASSQKPVAFVLWQSSQPNNLYSNQHCMEIGLSTMNDESCFEENHYVCEKPVIE